MRAMRIAALFFASVTATQGKHDPTNLFQEATDGGLALYPSTASSLMAAALVPFTVNGSFRAAYG